MRQTRHYPYKKPVCFLLDCFYNTKHHRNSFYENQSLQRPPGQPGIIESVCWGNSRFPLPAPHGWSGENPHTGRTSTVGPQLTDALALGETRGSSAAATRCRPALVRGSLHGALSQTWLFLLFIALDGGEVR